MTAVRNEKMQYLENLLTNFDEISFDDVGLYRPSGHYRAKHSNARWQTALIMKKTEQVQSPISAKY